MSKNPPKIEHLNLQHALEQAGYFADKNLVLQTKLALSTKPIAGAVLMGKAGTGKTSLTEALGKLLGYEYIYYQCVQGTREDDLMVKMLPCEHTKSGIKLYQSVIPKAIESSQIKKTILVLDEWDKTRASADSFLLAFLQNGTINHNGYTGQANMENLIVFLCMNDEREVSEPLLRRLPRIEIPILSATVVRKALEYSHKDHPYIENAILLYRRYTTVFSQMGKPVTIQELRQLLDGIMMAGEEADWNELVYMFVSKTEENHYYLKESEGNSLKPEITSKPELSIEKYEQTEEKEEEKQEQKTPMMPMIFEVKAEISNIEEKKSFEKKIKKSAGYITYSPESYSFFAEKLTNLPSLPHQLGNIAEVINNHIIIKNTVPITDFPNYRRLFGQKGKIVFYHQNCSFEQIKNLCNRGLRIVQISEKEILAVYKDNDAIQMRWTPQKGAEFICDLEKKTEFSDLFSLALRGDSAYKSIFESDFTRPEGDFFRNITPVLQINSLSEKAIKKLGWIETEKGYCSKQLSYRGNTLEFFISLGTVCNKTGECHIKIGVKDMSCKNTTSSSYISGVFQFKDLYIFGKSLDHYEFLYQGMRKIEVSYKLFSINDVKKAVSECIQRAEKELKILEERIFQQNVFEQTRQEINEKGIYVA